MANLNKRANKQGKQLFQSEGEPATSSAAKGKPGRKKQVLAANIIPGIPDSETVDTLQDQNQQIQQKCCKGSPDLSTIRMLMDATFPLRRREILTNNLRVWKLLKEYPPLENGNGNEVRLSLFLFSFSHFMAKSAMLKMNKSLKYHDRADCGLSADYCFHLLEAIWDLTGVTRSFA